MKQMPRQRRRRAIAAGLAAALVAVVGCVEAQTDQPALTQAPTVDYVDWVFYGGPIITMDPDLPTVEAIAVKDDLIVARGAQFAVLRLAGSQTRFVDLQGAALLPGFVDSHSHYFGPPDVNAVDVQQQILESGVTTVAELAVDPETLERLDSLAADNLLRLRVSAYLVAYDNCGNPRDDADVERVGSGDATGMLRVAGVKVFADGGSCGVPATSIGHDHDGSGDLYFTAGELVPILRDFDSAGYQIALHALGDRAMVEALEAFTEINGGVDNPLRHRIEHNAIVSPAFTGLYDAAGVVGTIFGSYPTCFFTRQSDDFAFRIDDEYLEWEWQWRRLLDGNPDTVFAWSADAGVFSDPTPVRALSGFVTRSEIGSDDTVCAPESVHLAGAITVDEALRLMTIDSAYVLHRDHEVGSLVEGKLADLVVLSADPRAVNAAELANLTVEMTMVGGRAESCAESVSHFCEQ